MTTYQIYARYEDVLITYIHKIMHAFYKDELIDKWLNGEEKSAFTHSNNEKKNLCRVLRSQKRLAEWNMTFNPLSHSSLSLHTDPRPQPHSFLCVSLKFHVHSKPLPHNNTHTYPPWAHLRISLSQKECSKRLNRSRCTCPLTYCYRCEYKARQVNPDCLAQFQQQGALGD